MDHSPLSGLMKPSGQCWTHTPKGKGSDDTYAHSNFLRMQVFFMSKHFHLILIKHII